MWLTAGLGGHPRWKRPSQGLGAGGQEHHRHTRSFPAVPRPKRIRQANGQCLLGPEDTFYSEEKQPVNLITVAGEEEKAIAAKTRRISSLSHKALGFPSYRAEHQPQTQTQGQWLISGLVRGHGSARSGYDFS